MIASGEIKLELGETVNIVSHSQGSAHAAGIETVLTKAGIKVEVNYNIAPKQPGDIPDGLARRVQYWSTMDGIAPQSPMTGVDERAKFPNTDYNTVIQSHFLSNYEWIFKIPKGKPGYVAPMKDKPKPKEEEKFKKRKSGDGTDVQY
jgi:hypothetical protein